MEMHFDRSGVPALAGAPCSTLIPMPDSAVRAEARLMDLVSGGGDLPHSIPTGLHRRRAVLEVLE
jgi:hypothetical protein